MYRALESDGLYSIVCGSDIRLVHDVIHDMKLFVARSGASTMGLSTVLRELLENAIVHGNRSDLSRKVICSLRFTPDDMLEITVEDEGDGFPHARLLHEIRLNSLKPRDWGYARVTAYSARIEFNEKGNRVSAYLIVV